MKLSINASYADGQRNVLDFKDMRYILDQGNLQFDSNFNPDRRYRYMDDNMLDSRVTLEIPISEDMRTSKLSGGGYNRSNRQNEQVLYNMRGASGLIFDGPLDQIITEDDFTLGGDDRSFYYTTGGTAFDSDIGFRDISAAFAKVDHQFTERLRVVGGVRVEYTDIFS